MNIAFSTTSDKVVLSHKEVFNTLSEALLDFGTPTLKNLITTSTSDGKVFSTVMHTDHFMEPNVDLILGAKVDYTSKTITLSYGGAIEDVFLFAKEHTEVIDNKTVSATALSIDGFKNKIITSLEKLKSQDFWKSLSLTKHVISFKDTYVGSLKTYLMHLYFNNTIGSVKLNELKNFFKKEKLENTSTLNLWEFFKDLSKMSEPNACTFIKDLEELYAELKVGFSV